MAQTKKPSSNKKRTEKELTASVVRPVSSRSARPSSTRSSSTRSSSSKSSSSRSSSTRSSSKAGAAKRKSGGASSAKSGAASSKSASRAPERRAPERKVSVDEIVGVILIALGIVMGILTYAKTNATFVTVVEALFKLFGVVQYAMPVLLVILGAVLIAVPDRQFGSGSTVLSVLAIYCITCVIHLFTVDPGTMTYKQYLSAGMAYGSVRRGGGLLASASTYWLAKFLSLAGAAVVFIALALVFLLLVTKLSIRTAGLKVKEKVGSMSTRRKNRPINERVGSDVPGSRSKGAPYIEEPEPEEELEVPNIKSRKRSRSHMRVDIEDLNDVIENAEPAKKGEPELSFLPRKGALPRKVDTGRREKAPVKQETVPVPEFPEPEFPEIDIYDTIEIVPEDNITGETLSDAMGEEASAPEKAAAKAADAGSETEAAEIAAPNAIPVYQRPPLSLLEKADPSEAAGNESPREIGQLLIDTLASFNINAKVLHISVGPVITRYEIQPAQGVRVNRITGLSNDIALALAAPRVRIEAPIPGKAAIGIEIPNKNTSKVLLRDVLDTREFSVASSPLTFALGKDIAGKPVYANLESMPHMLIAGTTGSGKSVCINSILLSTIYKSSPDEVRMILIDPKVVELQIFAPVPHLYCPVVTDAKKAAGVLKWACNEMDQRYSRMSKFNARELSRFNALQENPEDRMPRLMIVIDELADLMVVSAKDVEESICRLAQLGRAAGIHLIVATQRPSVDVITGLIKTNIPSRIAFAVSSAIDSRVILDAGGAEKLLGRGDMLFHPNGAAKPIRAQGAFVSDEEVERIMQFFIDHKIEVPQNESVLDAIPDLTAPPEQGNGKQEDDLLPAAARIVLEYGTASISMIQRRLRVGYSRAARLVDIMEQKKIVSGYDGSKARNVLIDEAGYREIFGVSPYEVPDGGAE
jgi:S-DNA-T family DNA segregation ATPase FtsK/SpoIIIE